MYNKSLKEVDALKRVITKIRKTNPKPEKLVVHSSNPMELDLANKYAWQTHQDHSLPQRPLC